MASSKKTSSLSLAIRDILDKIGSEDSFFPTETPDFRLPGISTPESAALEDSLRSLVGRFQELEQKAIHSTPVVKRVQSVKDDKTRQGVCSSCGHRLNSFGSPLTPEETPPRVDSVYSPKSIALVVCGFVLTG